MGDQSEPVLRSDLDREARHLQVLIETVLAERQRQLELQGLEYHRRLSELNNAHERAERAVQATVPRDLFDAFVSENNKWKENVAAELATNRGAAAASVRFFTVTTILLSLGFTALTIWLRSQQ